MKKFLVALVIITLGILPMAAHAAVDLTKTDTFVKFANQLVAASPTVTTVANSGGTINATSPLGFSIAAGTSKYVRINLTGDTAKFGTAAPTLTATAYPGGFTLSQGGIGQAFVIFEVAATGAGGDLAPTDVVTLASTTYTIVGSASSVTMSYALYGTASEAVNQTGALSTQSATFVTFPTGVLVTESHTKTPEQINVLDGSKTFVAGAPFTTTTNVMGEVSVVVDTTVHDPITGFSLTAGDIVQFVTATAALTLTGDFTATITSPVTLGNIFLDTSTKDCTTPDPVLATTALSGTAATITTAQNEIPLGTLICFNATGTIPIVATTFDGVYNTGGGKLANTSLPALDSFVKNSKALQSPWFSTQAGYTTRFILSNMGNAAVQFSVKAYAPTGATVTYKAPYNGLVTLNPGVSVINAKDMVSVAGSVNASIVFEFQGSSTTLQGEYQFLNLTTGVMDSVVMGPPNP